MATDDPNHESGGYWVNTGRKYAGPNMRSVSPDDWPTLGSIIKMLKPSPNLPFSSVMLPEPIIANPNVFLPGQNAGFLGHRWDPEIFRCDPSEPGFRVDDFSSLTEVPAGRLTARRSLLDQFKWRKRPDGFISDLRSRRASGSDGNDSAFTGHRPRIIFPGSHGKTDTSD